MKARELSQVSQKEEVKNPPNLELNISSGICSTFQEKPAHARRKQLMPIGKLGTQKRYRSSRNGQPELYITKATKGYLACHISMRSSLSDSQDTSTNCLNLSSAYPPKTKIKCSKKMVKPRKKVGQEDRIIN